MNLLVENEFWILPKPKYFDINAKENGITLSSLLTIYVNKYRIKDNALLLSSKFHKHLNTFLNAIPIRDSSIDEKWGEHYFFSIITSESHYDSQVKRNLNEIFEQMTKKYEDTLKDCCYKLYPKELESNLSIEESYFIEISDRTIWIISKTPEGFYYGIQTIIQIIEHTLFNLEKFEGYISIPKLMIVDIPDLKRRGISIEIPKEPPLFEFLKDLIPYLGKYKLNYITFTQSLKKSPREEEKKSILDLCKFHHIFPVFSNSQNFPESAILIEKNPQYDLPDYIGTVQRISESNNLESVFISIPEDWSISYDLLLLGIPLFANSFWNSKPLSKFDWILNSQALFLNIFENKLPEDASDFLKIIELCSTGENSDLIHPILKKLKSIAYENKHILTSLEKILFPL